MWDCTQLYTACTRCEIWMVISGYHNAPSLINYWTISTQFPPLSSDQYPQAFNWNLISWSGVSLRLIDVRLDSLHPQSLLRWCAKYFWKFDIYYLWISLSRRLSLALTNHTSILLITDITSSHWSIGSIHLLTELIAAASLASLPQESAAFSSLTVSSLPALVSKTSQSRSCCGARAIIIFVHTLLVPGSKCLYVLVCVIYS